VLIVDDNIFNVSSLKDILEDIFGLRCAVAFNGKEALDIVNSRTCCEFQIIFMDNMMPVMDGKEATKLIKSLPGQSQEKYGAKIIGLSAN